MWWRAALLPAVALSLTSPLTSHLSARVDRLKCPFFRRRLGDAVEVIKWAEALRESSTFVAARHKSLLGQLGPLVSNVSVEPAAAPALALADVLTSLRSDFEDRQYYTTGRLSADLYDAECFFDSPDFDMPVRSTRAFASALRGLFFAPQSKIELLDIRLGFEENTVVAEWRLEGRLKLPWRPLIKPFVGRTTFTTNAETGLVVQHVEEWSVSALDAFISTLLPFLSDALSAAAPPTEMLLVSATDPAANLELAHRFPALGAPRQ
ncbi:hypothetical protein M885DRAFT_535450 [Pelagophyceae sp. CCMP2097]|nr:hypothetical protein M885DRAFT_535450 [Pelagophyceae sp. CCMP2097]